MSQSHEDLHDRELKRDYSKDRKFSCDRRERIELAADIHCASRLLENRVRGGDNET